MASQSFNLIGQEEEQELVAFGTRQSRGPTPLSRPNSRMEEMVSHLIRIQEEATKSQDAMTKSLENRIAENIRFHEVSARALEAKMSALAQLRTSTDDRLSNIAYIQIEQRSEMSDLVDRMSTVERSLQGSPFTGSDPTRRSLASPGHALMASAPYPLSLATPSSLALERSIEEVGFRPLKVIGRPIDKGSVNTTQGQRWRVLEVGENIGQERIIEYHTVGPEVQRIQNPVEALFPVERIGVAPGVSTGLAPQKYHTSTNVPDSSHYSTDPPQAQKATAARVSNYTPHPGRLAMQVTTSTCIKQSP